MFGKKKIELRKKHIKGKNIKRPYENNGIF
jgi:hypothetical protein